MEGKDKTLMTTITIRIPVAIKEAVQEEAVRNDRNLTQQITFALRPYLSQIAEAPK